MRDLARRLNGAADKAEQLPDMWTLNSMGEVQGRGPEIDRACALLREKYDARNKVTAYWKEA